MNYEDRIFVADFQEEVLNVLFPYWEMSWLGEDMKFLLLLTLIFLLHILFGKIFFF